MEHLTSFYDGVMWVESHMFDGLMYRLLFNRPHNRAFSDVDVPLTVECVQAAMLLSRSM
jgi:hypothetical protein